MAYANRKMVEDLYQLVDNGYEPTFGEVIEKYFSNNGRTDRTKIDTATQQKLARLLIYRVRRLFKKEEPSRFFYEVGGVYKLLSSSEDSLGVVNRLAGLTNGFQKASMNLIDDTAQKYPVLAKEFVYEIQASFRQIGILADVAIRRLSEGLTKYESSNK